MHVCTALRSKTSPIGPDRPIRVGVLSRLPFTKLDQGRRSRTKCESFSKATGTPTRYRPWKKRRRSEDPRTRAGRWSSASSVASTVPSARGAYVGRVPSG